MPMALSLSAAKATLASGGMVATARPLPSRILSTFMSVLHRSVPPIIILGGCCDKAPPAEGW